MRPDAVTISNQARFGLPKGWKPQLILDVGYRTKKSTFEIFNRFPQAEILSFQYENSNFLLDANALAYHDNIIFKSFNINSFHLDDFIYGYNSQGRDAKIDFINLHVQGKEKEIFKSGGIWPGNTRFLRAVLGPDYDYKEAKQDLGLLGFRAYAMYDNKSFYVVGENYETFSGDTSSYRDFRRR